MAVPGVRWRGSPLMRVRDRPQDRSTERRPIQRQESIQGAALSIEDAIADVQRGRGERKRPSSGWASLTPTELDVARLGMPNFTSTTDGTEMVVPVSVVDKSGTEVVHADITCWATPS